MADHTWTKRETAPLRHDEDGILLCPECGCEYIHVDRTIVHGYTTWKPNEVRKVSALDHDAKPTTVGGYPFSSDKERSSFSLVAWCEEGHDLVISFVQHEGRTSIDIFTRQSPGDERRGN